MSAETTGASVEIGPDALFDRAPGVMFLCRGADHVVARASARFAELAGTTTPCGLALAQLLPAARPLADVVLATGESVGPEEVVVARAEGDVVLALACAPIRDGSGVVTGVLGQGTDVTRQATERRDAVALVERLRAERQWYETLLDQLPTPALLIEPETARIVFANAAADRLAGGKFPQGAPKGEYGTPYPCTYPDGREIPADELPRVRAARGEVLHGFEMDWHLPNGARSLVLDSGRLPAQYGHPEMIVVSFRDVTDLKRAERAIIVAHEELQAQSEELQAQSEELNDAYERLKRYSEAVEAEVVIRTNELRLAHAEAESRRLFMEAIVERLPGGLAYLDASFQFVLANPAYARFIGRPLEALLGRNVWAVLPETEATVRPLFEQVRETRQPLSGLAMPVPLSDGESIRETFWDYTINPLVTPEGVFQGWLALCFEVSERREAERIKDEFLSVISHELRTPLNFIMGFASTLEDGLYGQLTQDQLEAVRRILNGADRMVVLVDDLLDYAKLQAGKFELAPIPAPYKPLVEEAVALMRPLADQRGIALTAEVDIDVAARLDPTRVTQALTNLISNALKFTERGGAVTVRVTLAGGRIRTSVCDTGCGISAEDMPRLFQRFQQLDMSRTRRAGGTGLGLAITKAIVEAHGGEIGVESKPGVGSTFWFDVLPA